MLQNKINLNQQEHFKIWKTYIVHISYVLFVLYN